VTLGFLTFGQSPRTDVTSDLPESLRSLEFVEVGALDDLSAQQIESLKPHTDQTVYVSRLRDGSEVTIAEERLIPLLNEKLKLLEHNDVEATVLLCSGRLDLESRSGIIFPSMILEHAVQCLHGQVSRLGVLVPDMSQVQEAVGYWSAFAQDVKALGFSPYSGSKKPFDSLAKAFLDRDLIVLDCIGYSSEHRKTVRALSGKPVISARGITFRFLEELFSR